MSEGEGAEMSVDDKELSGGTGSPHVDATNVDVSGTRSCSGRWKMKGGTSLKEGPPKDPPR
jgi:hypothetical protein